VVYKIAWSNPDFISENGIFVATSLDYGISFEETKICLHIKARILN